MIRRRRHQRASRGRPAKIASEVKGTFVPHLHLGVIHLGGDQELALLFRGLGEEVAGHHGIAAAQVGQDEEAVGLEVLILTADDPGKE